MPSRSIEDDYKHCFKAKPPGACSLLRLMHTQQRPGG